MSSAEVNIEALREVYPEISFGETIFEEEPCKNGISLHDI